jgi:hypothetical protein
MNRVPVTVIKPVPATVNEDGELGLVIAAHDKPLQLKGGSIVRQCVALACSSLFVQCASADRLALLALLALLANAAVS